MATTRLMPLHVGKGRSFSAAISDIINYVENPEKTDRGQLVTSYQCNARIADKEFQFAKQRYIQKTGRVRGADDVIAYHLRQSFVPGEITPEKANRLGDELAMRFTKGRNAYIVCTHTDKAHVHNHIIISSVNVDCDRKFRNFWGSTKALRRLNDTLCIENGYSIVENPKRHGKSYNKWLGDLAGLSHRERLCYVIDEVLKQKPESFDALLDLLRQAGYEIKGNPGNPSLRGGVLCGFRGNCAYINDPARGSVRVSMEEFDKSYTGIVLGFTPAEGFQPDGKRTSTFVFARKRLAGAGAAMIFVMLTGVIGSVFTLLSPAFSRFFMDRLLTGENDELLLPFTALVAGVSLLQILVAAVRALYSLKINGKMAVIGSGSFLWKVLKMPMEFFSQRMTGDILTRHRANETIAEKLVNTLAPLLPSAVMMVFYLVVMLRYSPLLTLIGLVSILINVAMSRVISDKRVNVTRVQTRDAGKLASATVSGIKMIETIKASGAENGYFRRWAGFQASVNQQNVKLSRLNQTYGTIPAFVTTLANALVLVLCVRLCMRGEFTLGMVTAFQSFLASFISPAMTLVTAGQTLQEMRTQMERVEDVMEYPEDEYFSDEPVSEEKDYDKLSGEVALCNVTFGYSKLDAPLIENFSLHIKPGGRVALVGASGCGKSTISKLISGLYRPWSGEILFDGKPISEIDRAVFTGSVAVVDQDVILFNDTIANNIKMWDESIEDFEMILAARDAQIHDDIMARPGGYQSRIAEGGRDLSGGQRQRLEIARVLAQDPHIVIMDEATSALDARTEYELTKAVKERGVACIIIAHRLSTIRDCDEIIVLDHGKVMERGTHEELYAKGGYYTELITSD